MRQKITIAGKPVDYQRCFIIAEAGVNHNGRLDFALRLVDKAAETGADAVKFQTFKAEQVTTDRGEMADYQKQNLGKVESQKEMLSKIELKEEFYQPIIKRCRERKIIFLSTPHGGIASVDFLESLNIAAYKIASADLTNYLMLKKIARLNKPIILSTGMATLKEVKEAVRFIKNNRNHKIIVLHCTSNYPCPFSEINLAAMETLKKQLKTLVGYSDHSEGQQVAVMAGTLRMAVYECHFTLDKKLPGPDHLASATPEELKEKIKSIRRIQEIMGHSDKQPSKSELQQVMRIARKSLVAASDLAKGKVIVERDLEAKRPGDGISPIFFQKLIGKTLIRNLRKDEQFSDQDFAKKQNGKKS